MHYSIFIFFLALIFYTSIAHKDLGILGLVLFLILFDPIHLVGQYFSFGFLVRDLSDGNVSETSSRQYLLFHYVSLFPIVSFFLLVIFRNFRQTFKHKYTFLEFSSFLYFAGIPFLGLIGEVPGFFQRDLTMIFFIYCLILSSEFPLSKYIAFARGLGLFLAFFSLFGMVFWFDLMVFPGKQFFLLGWDYFLAGPFSHKNGFGQVVGVIMILSTCSPGPFFQKAALICLGFICLVLASAKTSFFAVIVAILVYFYSKTQTRENRRKFLPMIYYILLLSFSAGLGYWIIQNVLMDSIISQSEALQSFSGRLEAWEVATEIWQRNLFFGYGPTIFSQTFNASYNLPTWAGMAHNQFLQTLAQSGLVGLTFLLFFLFALGKTAYEKLSLHDSLLHFPVFIFLVPHLFVEVPFPMGIGLLPSLILPVFFFKLDATENTVPSKNV